MGVFLLLRINERLQNLKQFTVTLKGRRDLSGGDHHACNLGHRLDITGPQDAAEVGSSVAGTLAFQATGRARHEVNELRRISLAPVDLLLGSDRTVSGKA